MIKPKLLVHDLGKKEQPDRANPNRFLFSGDIIALPTIYIALIPFKYGPNIIMKSFKPIYTR